MVCANARCNTQYERTNKRPTGGVSYTRKTARRTKSTTIATKLRTPPSDTHTLHTARDAFSFLRHSHEIVQIFRLRTVLTMTILATATLAPHKLNQLTGDLRRDCDETANRPTTERRQRRRRRRRRHSAPYARASRTPHTRPLTARLVMMTNKIVCACVCVYRCVYIRVYVVMLVCVVLVLYLSTQPEPEPRHTHTQNQLSRTRGVYY